MKQFKLILAAIIILFGTAVYAQPEDIKETADTFIPDFSSDPDMKPVAGAPGFALNYGGWITSLYLDSTTKNDAGDTELSSSLSMAKIWMKASLIQNLFIYARGKYTYLKIMDDTNEGTENEAEDSDNLELDAAYLSWSTDNNMLKISLGRKLYNIGTGIVCSGIGDGGEIDFYSKFIDINAFGMYTGLLDKDSNPYNLSDKDISDGAKRVFAGGTISRTILNQKIYLLGMYQMDKGDDTSSTIKTTYNSIYYGAGLEGTLLGAQYYAEYIMESGESYLKDSDEKKDVKAQAGNFGLNYYFNIILKPAILLSYSWGSGDNNRNDPATGTDPNGNRGGNDLGFIYFGNFVGGFALRPELTNIHIYRAGFSINPVSYLSSKKLNRMSLIFKYSYYRRDVSSGAISDTTATVGASNIGDGYDVSIRWKIFYDLSIFANYGLFKPGDAYTPDAGNRTFIMAGINLMI